MADMAASQDRNRDIDNRHQDHQQHQASQPSYPEPTSPLTSIKLQLLIMSSDHPPVDPTKRPTGAIDDGASGNPIDALHHLGRCWDRRGIYKNCGS
ncbi:hypothetical protein MVEG_11338 [Podila verticillata NRRL 6337]|uniref:Uncharacterized protein n=1 Tax=Podila verticillata NRRL 6337 TaxID=1069443 RepID=A0A086TLI5_9FUNG|nr:hypothetical protein MVEG_11338 [Podila verticillata NRRL 6337]